MIAASIPSWVGVLPTRWRWGKLGALASVKARLGWRGLKADEYVESGYIFLATPNIKGREIDFKNVNYIGERRYLESPEIMLRAGDVLLAKDGSTLGTVNLVRHLPGAATVNSSLAVVRPKEGGLDSGFLYYFFQSSPVQSFIERVKDGMGVPHLFQADIRKFDVPLPPQHEQAAIAVFLDRKTAAIDALIAKKERLIELLQEKRQALITQAVTKGLDLDVPMKESGVEWLGSIPAQWAIVRVSYVTNVRNGSTPDRNRGDYWNEGAIPWVSSGKVNDYIVTEADEFITERALRETSVRLLPKGTVLVGMVGQGKTRGMSAFMDLDACINQNVAGLTPRSQIDGRFLHHLLVAAYQPLREFGRGGQQDALNCDIIKSFRIPLPPVGEQKCIARLLDEQSARIGKLYPLVGEHIKKLVEYRQALITAAVTGQLDVSSEAA